MDRHQIKHQIADGIATLSFSSENHNALSLVQLQELADRIIALGQDQSIKAILLRSGGDRTFCAGANLKELSGIRDEQAGHTFFRGFANVLNAMRTCGKIIIGCVQGKAVGGGVGIIAACDYIFATKWASVKLSEISIGIGPFVIEPAIRRKIGVAHLSHLALNPTEWKSAAWCQQVGLYQKVYEDMEALENDLVPLLSRYKTFGAESLRSMKTVLWEGTSDWYRLLDDRAALSAKLLLTSFTQKSLQKYASSS